MKEQLIKNLECKILNGRQLHNDERILLEGKFDSKLFPIEIIDLLSTYNIIGQTFFISEDDDPTGLGVDMEWFTPAAQVEEAFEYFPGSLVVQNGYLPVGMCLSGSGDPYFLKTIDQKYGLFRVPHDAINEGSYDYDSVEFICMLDELFDSIV
uniref:hypothetical protein n=1 Tax=Pedobacter schmidteae TaxID=2201271 RepID=UPI000EAC5745|nr:hypothetical protein [Pedobacter schmidteae]